MPTFSEDLFMSAGAMGDEYLSHRPGPVSCFHSQHVNLPFLTVEEGSRMQELRLIHLCIPTAWAKAQKKNI